MRARLVTNRALSVAARASSVSVRPLLFLLFLPRCRLPFLRKRAVLSASFFALSLFQHRFSRGRSPFLRKRAVLSAPFFARRSCGSCFFSHRGRIFASAVRFLISSFCAFALMRQVSLCRHTYLHRRALSSNSLLRRQPRLLQ